MIQQMLRPESISFEDTGVAFSSQDDRELRNTYLLFTMMNNPTLVKLGTTLTSWAFKLKLPVNQLVKATVFSHFCGGESIRDCNLTIQHLADFNIHTILDYAVEGTKDEKSFDDTTQEIIATISKAAQSPHIPFSVFKPTGIAPFTILEKVHAKKTLTEQEQQAFQRIRMRFDTICKAAYEHQVKIMVDAEESWIQDAVDLLVEEMMQKYNREKPLIYNTYQMYLSASLDRLLDDIEKAHGMGYFVGAKLVRGAYMEKERKRAAIHKYPDPIQINKRASDRDYDKALELCIDQRDLVGLVAATHNEQSSYYLTALMDKFQIAKNDPNIYFAQLYGMSDHISYNLSFHGYNVVKYVPYGPVEKVMPYLIRRAEENTSIAGQSSRELTLVKKEITRRKMRR